MSTDGSATRREETPHANEPTITITDAVRRQAQSIIDDTSIDPEWRAVIRHYLEADDPWVAALLPRAQLGETVINTVDFAETVDLQTVEFPQTNDVSQTLELYDDKSSVERVEALTEIICSAGDESTAALFVLMGTLQNSPKPAMLANAAKHYAFTRCGEMNVFGIVDAQIAVVEGELLGSSTVVA